MRVAELLAGKGDVVAYVGPGASIRDALSLLAEAGVGALVVSRDGVNVEGIVSERDIVREMCTAGASIFGRTVAELMSAKVYSCGLDTEIETLGELMTDQHIRHVPVIEDDQLRGIVSIGDVVKWRITLLQNDRKELLEYGSAR